MNLMSQDETYYSISYNLITTYTHVTQQLFALYTDNIYLARFSRVKLFKALSKNIDIDLAMEPEAILKESLPDILGDKICRNNVVTIKPVSSGGSNYTSSLFDITVTNKENENLNLFAKVAILGEDMRTTCEMKAFKIENIFHTKMSREYEAIQDKFNLRPEHRFNLVKFYGCKLEYMKETFIFDNLVAKGYRSHDRMVPVCWEYAASAMTQLARFHALSFAYQKHYPKEFEEQANISPFDKNSKGLEEFVNNMRDIALKVIKDEFKDIIHDYIDKGMFQAWTEWFTPRKQKVLIHGDYRPSNLLHKEINGKIDIVPVDFQTISAGCPVTDLLYFIFTTSDKEFRAKYYTKLIDYYYQELGASLARLDIDVKEVYPEEDFRDDLEALKMLGLNIAISLLAIVYVEVDDAPTLQGDINDVHFSPSKRFEEVINGIITDYIEWGLL